jgi:hypothetical protein
MTRYGACFLSPSPKKTECATNFSCFSNVPKGPPPLNSKTAFHFEMGPRSTRLCNFCGFHVNQHDWDLQHAHHHDGKEVWKAFTKKDDMVKRDLTSWIKLYDSKPTSFSDLPAWMAQVTEHLSINNDNKENGVPDNYPTKTSMTGESSIESID